MSRDLRRTVVSTADAFHAPDKPVLSAVIQFELIEESEHDADMTENEARPFNAGRFDTGQGDENGLGIGQQSISPDELAAEFEELARTPGLRALVAKDWPTVAESYR